MYFSFNSPWPYVVLMPLIILISVVIYQLLPFYKNLVKHESKERHDVLDGLRGLLAFGVFFQHAVTNYSYFNTGIWKITDVKFYRHLGGESVILFFIITSFLYWSKAIRKKGEIDVPELYRSRILRLAPMYLFTAGIVTVLALWVTEFDLQSLRGFVHDMFSWLSLGLQTTTHVNGVTIIPFNAGIHWTLHFEWVFYLLLPITAIALKNREMRYLSIPLLIYLFLAPDRGYWMIFFFGMVAAHIVHWYPELPWRNKWWLTIIPILGLSAVYVIQYKPYSILQYFVTLFVFLSFVYGNDLLGLLRLSVMKFLGTISYSIYLMHGIVLYVVLHLANNFKPITEHTPLMYWYLILVAGVLTVAVSAVTYRYVEHPFIHQIKPKQPQTSPGELTDRII